MIFRFCLSFTVAVASLLLLLLLLLFCCWLKNKAAGPYGNILFVCLTRLIEYIHFPWSPTKDIVFLCFYQKTIWYFKPYAQLEGLRGKACLAGTLGFVLMSLLGGRLALDHLLDGQMVSVSWQNSRLVFVQLPDMVRRGAGGRTWVMRGAEAETWPTFVRRDGRCYRFSRNRCSTSSASSAWTSPPGGWRWWRWRLRRGWWGGGRPCRRPLSPVPPSCFSERPARQRRPI